MNGLKRLILLDWLYFLFRLVGFATQGVGVKNAFNISDLMQKQRLTTSDLMQKFIFQPSDLMHESRFSKHDFLKAELISYVSSILLMDF